MPKAAMVSKELLQKNWKSGLTVALVSIPLSMALAIASGATPTQGIITALWAGLIASIFGGSNYNITGPTGALSGILITYTIIHGYEALPVIALLSGIFILIAYFFHLDRYIIFIPSSVVHGFTLGVAFIIAIGQLENILGLENIQKTNSVLKNIYIILQHHENFNLYTIVLFVLGLCLIFSWNKIFPKFPGTIVLAILAIIISYSLSQYPISNFKLISLADKYPNIQAEFFLFSWIDNAKNNLLIREVWIIAIITAVVAILETLLSGQIADNLTKTKFKRSAEVKALGLANLASGICGGIPATAALARTALNIKSGANHRISATLNSFFIFFIAFIILPYFKWLPMVAIASILVYVSISMVQTKHFIHLIQNEKTAFILSIIVAIITIVEDPMMGILIGSITALLIFVNNIAKGQTEIEIWQNNKLQKSLLRTEFLQEKNIQSDFIVYSITGALTYINMPAHLKTAEQITGQKYVILSLKSAFYIDIDGILYLEEIIDVLKRNNQKVILVGVNNQIETKIKNQEFYHQKLNKGKIYKNISDAITAIYSK